MEREEQNRNGEGDRDRGGGIERAVVGRRKGSRKEDEVQ